MSVLVKGMKMPKDCRECCMAEYHINTGKTWCKPADGLLAVNFKPIPFEGRPDWCPLVELPKGEWLRMSDLSEKDDNRYKCSRCGNVIHHKSRMALYTFNSWCGRCGSDNSRHTTIIEVDKWEEDAPTVIEAKDEE